jgi:hypothetical protein
MSKPIHHTSYQSLNGTPPPETPSYWAALSEKVGRFVRGPINSVASCFKSSSTPAISQALENATPSSLNLSLTSSNPKTEKMSTARKDESPPTSASKTHNNQAKIGGVMMKFTMKVNGQDIPLDENMLEQLKPILNELAETSDEKEKLLSGFTCHIDLDDLKNIRFYHKDVEILKGASESLFIKNGEFLQKMESFKQLVEIGNVLNTTKRDSSSGKKTEEAKVLPRYVKVIEGNGDCLLKAVAMHIKKKSPETPQDELTADALRRAIAAQAERDIGNPMSLDLMVYEIQEAVDFATKDGKDLTQTKPFASLLKREVLLALKAYPSFSDETIMRTLVNAYTAYILDDTNPTRPSLGGYAISYLDTKYFSDERLFIVQKHRDDYENGFVSFPSSDRPVVDSGTPNDPNKLRIPTLLYNGNHYDFIDSGDVEFWQAYQKGEAAKEKANRNGDPE